MKKDLTEIITHQARQKLQKLDRNITEKELYWKLKPSYSPRTRLYGFPKIDKPEIPIIPLV